VKLDLDVDTHNYLRTAPAFCPRILVVLVMPADESEWVKQSPERRLPMTIHPLASGSAVEQPARSAMK